MSFQDNRDRLESFYREATKERKKLFLLSDMPKRTLSFGILKTGGSCTRKEGGDRPRKFLVSDRRRLAGIALKNTNFSSQQIAHRFREKAGRLMSKRSAHRNLFQSRIRKILPRRIPLLTPAHFKKEFLSLDIGNRTDSRMFF